MAPKRGNGFPRVGTSTFHPEVPVEGGKGEGGPRKKTTCYKMELYKFYGLYYSCKWKNNFRKWPIVIHSKLWSFHPILIGVTNLFSAIYQGYKSIEKDWFGTHLWGKVEE